jgi:hypothetical protein
MLLLITGASGVGKTTVRKLVAPRFADRLDAYELAEVAGPPQWNLRWRHQAVEQAVQLAIHAQTRGRHLLLCGDPVAPAEVFATPSAPRIERIAICLLDADEDSQRSRLAARGDDPSLIPRHVAFAAWMREHLVDPTQRLEAITTDGWEEMQWDRALATMRAARIAQSHCIDTSDRTPSEVAAEAARWISAQLDGASH